MKKESEIYVIQNSGGRSSAYMTERLLQDEKYKNNCIILFQNTGKENDATLDFVNECDRRWQALYGKQIYWLEYNPDSEKKFDIVDFFTAHRTADITKKSPFEKLIKKRKFLPNRVARFCTQDLKIRISKYFMLSLGYKHWKSCIGIRYDEPRRHNSKVDLKERFENFMPMIEWKTTKEDVNNFWKQMPFDLQLKPHEGNCDLCFLKGAGKKRQIIREHPEKADWWIKMENEIGATFRKDFHIKALKMD